MYIYCIYIYIYIYILAVFFATITGFSNSSNIARKYRMWHPSDSVLNSAPDALLKTEHVLVHRSVHFTLTLGSSCIFVASSFMVHARGQYGQSQLQCTAAPARCVRFRTCCCAVVANMKTLSVG